MNHHSHAVAENHLLQIVRANRRFNALSPTGKDFFARAMLAEYRAKFPAIAEHWTDLGGLQGALSPENYLVRALRDEFGTSRPNAPVGVALH